MEPNSNHRARRPFAPFNREHRENSDLPRLFRRRGRAHLHLVRERPASRPVRFCWLVAGSARTSAKLNPQCLQRDLCLANLLKGALGGLPRLASSPTLLSVWNKAGGITMARTKLCLTALLIAALAACTANEKTWIVVSIKKPDGRLARVSFDGPPGADTDLQTCILSLKSAASDLMLEINGMPDLRGSHFLSATCVQSDKNPVPDQV